MKKIEFKTSKGEFVLVDLKGEVNTETICTMNDLGYCIVNAFSLITEQQASEIVDSQFVFHTEYVKDIMTYYPNYESKSVFFYNSLESLHSLIKSLGIYLYENTLGNFKVYKKNFKGHDMFYSNYIAKWHDNEQKTFYNPYIFKKI